MKFKSLFIVSTLLISASQPTFAENDPTVATVNGQDIKNSMLQFYALERSQQNSDQAAPNDRLIKDLVDMSLLAEQAKSKKLDNQEDFKARMSFINLSMLSQVAMIDFLDNNEIPEERLKKEYDQHIGDMAFKEYKASHILLNDETVAKEVISKLNKGTKFEDLAKEYSKGPTGSKGGDLGWFDLKRMVPEFSQALAALKDKAYTKEAVQTQFGWHVILRTGERDGTPPSFEELKPRISASLEQELIQSHLKALRKGATINITEEKK